MDSPAFLDTIIAWSSTHLALRDASLESLALECRGKALRSLGLSVASSKRQPEVELACCLVQCAMESIAGDTKHWHLHMDGAHSVINSVCHTDGSRLDFQKFATFEGRWLLRSFAYHDIMASVAEGRKPLIVAGHYWLLDDQEPPDSYFGLGSRVLYLISEISVLNAELALPSQTPDDDQLRTRFQELEERLLSWTCDPRSQSPDLVNLAEMYRSAALIHLYRTAQRHPGEKSSSLREKIDATATDIVDRLDGIPKNSLVESSLLFPIFMAGGEAHDPGQFEILRQRMQDIVYARHLYNYTAALDVLEELWHLRLSGKQIDWRDVLERRRWKLSIT